MAYRQVARTKTIPNDIARRIRAALTSLAMNGHLNRERHATEAHLSRLDQAPHFLSVLRLLLHAPSLALSAPSIAIIALTAIYPTNDPSPNYYLALASVSLLPALGFRICARSLVSFAATFLAIGRLMNRSFSHTPFDKLRTFRSFAPTTRHSPKFI